MCHSFMRVTGIPLRKAVPCFILLCLCSSVHASSCVNPQGIDDSTPGAISSVGLKLPRGEVFKTFIEQAGIPILSKYETPIQFRLIQMVNIGIYSVVAAFHPTSLDHFARTKESNDRRRCTPNKKDGPDKKNDPLFELHYDLTLAYVLWYSSIKHVPEIEGVLKPVLLGWGMDLSKCTLAVPSSGCDDTSTPWGLAYTLSKEAFMFSQRDGWNHDGSLSGTYNKIPYKDFRQAPYVPVNDPWNLQNRDRWQPLLETNHLGYLTHQEHVTPHVGHTGRGIFMSDADHCSLTAPDPEYNYAEEVQKLLQRSAALDDTKKMQVEAFDSKLTSLVPLMAQWFARQGKSLDRFEFIQMDSIIITVLYETVMLVWREKVDWDKVRPPTRLHSELQGQTVTGYAGPFQSTQQMPASDWQPYVRTMPHAEYPSGSSCVCTAFATAMKEMKGDDVTAALGNQPVVLQIKKGSSKIEPGVTPQNDINLAFTKWSEIAGVCGESRLDGGMHFTKSIEAGANLCSSVGVKIAQAFKKLETGQRPDAPGNGGYVVDFFNPNPSFAQNRCGNNHRRQLPTKGKVVDISARTQTKGAEWSFREIMAFNAGSFCAGIVLTVTLIAATAYRWKVLLPNSGKTNQSNKHFEGDLSVSVVAGDAESLISGPEMLVSHDSKPVIVY